MPIEGHLLLFHTSRLVVDDTHEVFRSALGHDFEIRHFVDEEILPILTSPEVSDERASAALSKLFSYFDELRVDAIQCTCTSVSTVLLDSGKVLKTPLLTVDKELAAEYAEGRWEAPLLIVTVSSTVEPTLEVFSELHPEGRRPDHLFLPEAFEARRKGDILSHNAILLTAIKERSKDHDAVLLPQASMLRGLSEISKESALPVHHSLPLAAKVLADTWFHIKERRNG